MVLLLDDPVERSPIKGYVVSLLKMAAILDFSTSRLKKKHSKVQKCKTSNFFQKKTMTRRHVTSDHSDPSLL